MSDSRNFKRGWMTRAVLLFWPLAVCGIPPSPTRAADVKTLAQPTTRPADIDPRAEEVLRAAAKYLDSAKSFTFKADTWEDVVLAEGQKIQRQRISEVGIRRPDRIYAESHNERIGRGLWYDGKTVTIYNRMKNFYGVMDAPETIDKTIEMIGDKFGVSMPLSELLVSDVYTGLIRNVRRGDYLGRQVIDGARCNHLAFVQDDVDWEIWVEDQNTPVIRKVVITYKTEDRLPSFTANLSDWNFDARLPDYAFTFRAPLDASKIDVLPAAAEPTDASDSASLARDVQPATQPVQTPDRKD